jgi:Spy/CpxP family protein refolding chaperone
MKAITTPFTLGLLVAVSLVASPILRAADIDAPADVQQTVDSSKDDSAPASNKKTGHSVSVEAKKRNRLNKLKTQVNLTPEQENKIVPVIDKYVDQITAIKTDSSLDPTAKKAQLKALRMQYNTDINGVLTPEQQDQWKAAKTTNFHKTKPATTGADTPKGS